MGRQRPSGGLAPRRLARGPLLPARRRDLRLRWDGFTEEELEGLRRRAAPAEDLSYAPLYRRPHKIWGIGPNYAEHAGDLDERAPAEEPASSMRPDTTIIGPGDTIRLPEGVERVTAGAELVVVAGRRAKDIGEDEAPSVVVGFTIVLDMTAEDILRRNPRYLTRTKSFDTFFSFGPQLLTPTKWGRWKRSRWRPSSTARCVAGTLYRT